MQKEIPMRQIQKEYQRSLLKKVGKVSLLQWERMGVLLYAVEYPGHFGKREMQVFANRVEADPCFDRFAKFFKKLP